jgi:hypothetical protein
MKVITITRSARHQTQPLVSDSAKLHTVNETSVTLVVPYILDTKDMFLTFSEQELRTFLSYIEERNKAAGDLVGTLRGERKPNDSGSLV